MRIYLIGLPGSGKTTLGKRIAAELNISFIDLDHEVEKTEGISVQEIFRTKGQDYFRKAESKVLGNLANSNFHFVLATGGGAPCFFNNMEIMNQSGTTIFLNVPLQEILNRILRTDLTIRPLFSGLNAEEVKSKLLHLHQERIPFYSKARIQFTKENLQAKEILEAIKG
jgi:shikimate kinase